MTVERGTFISQLDEQNPKSFDMLKEGDDHIRLIKAVSKNTLPRFDNKVDMSSTQMNKLYSWLMAIEDDPDDPEELTKFTVLEDMEIRKDLYFTEAGTDGTDNASTPESPKISGLADIILTTDEKDDPDLIPEEKLSRAVNFRFAEDRYAKRTTFEELDISTLVYEDVAEATARTDKVTITKNLFVHGRILSENEIDTILDLQKSDLNIKTATIKQDLKVTGNIYRGSDKRIKTDIIPLGNITIDDVVPVSYTKLGKKEYGVIAQDLPSELDHVVSTQHELLSVDYIQFIPILIKEIQDLKHEIRELKGDKG